jgi:hypothetical protein
MSLRFLCVVALCLAVTVSAAGSIAKCDASTLTGGGFGNFTGCAAVKSCHAKFCTCLGDKATDSPAPGTCATKTANCSQTHLCTKTLFKCIIDEATAAVNNSACMTAVSGLHSSLVAVTSGFKDWNMSTAFSDCNREACLLYNQSASGVCTGADAFSTICEMSPISFTGTLRLGGNFTNIFSNSTSKAALAACLKSDLNNHLRYPTTVDSYTLDAATGNCVVQFTVYTAYASVDQQIKEMEKGTAWMTCLTAEKFAALGGTGTLTSEVTLQFPTPPATPDPNAAPPASASMMWSALQIIVAVVAVLVIA